MCGRHHTQLHLKHVPLTESSVMPPPICCHQLQAGNIIIFQVATIKHTVHLMGQPYKQPSSTLTCTAHPLFISSSRPPASYVCHPADMSCLLWSVGTWQFSLHDVSCALAYTAHSILSAVLPSLLSPLCAIHSPPPRPPCCPGYIWQGSFICQHPN